MTLLFIVAILAAHPCHEDILLIPAMLAQTVAILCTDKNSKVACLFVTPRRPRSSLIEEWWINVHAFDLAGTALSNRVPLS